MNNIVFLLVLLIMPPTYLCLDINNLFKNINEIYLKFNAKAANIAWESSINPGNSKLPQQAAAYQKKRIKWEGTTCKRLATLQKSQLLNVSQTRMTYLLCRGPKYSFREARQISNIYEELQTIYTEAEICIPSANNITLENIKEIESAILNYLTTAKHFINPIYHNDNIVTAAKLAANAKIVETKEVCLKGEDDFEKVMASAKNEAVLRWTWLVWREKVGPPMKEPYMELVDIENAAAKRNGYHDIGESWRDELEIPHLRQVCRRLFNSIKPLYELLHGVVRFYLRRHYGDIVPETGLIPAHLTGNLWSQNWEPLAELMLSQSIDLDQSIKTMNWTVLHMAKRAEDFYQSLGLPAMTDTFWRESVLLRGNKDTRCHGAAADMFIDDDFRLLYCSGTTKEDFYVLHHEMGHIQYYMAYEKQPALFRQANTAFHESIGDAIMYGVMTPQHLCRLGLINDSLLYTDAKPISKFQDIDIAKIKSEYNRWNGNELKDEAKHNNLDDINEQEVNIFETTDDVLILKQALNKIPQIPFALLIDEFRWKFFEGDISKLDLNKEFWQMARDLQGIAPSTKRGGEEYFDVGAKFHVPDNTPYIRYFLSSFLQHQLFESLCKAAVFGRRDSRDELPDSITLNRCDIYGSKTAGKLLKDLMSRGHSQHWRDILRQTIGESDISASSLQRYYRPLYNLLLKLVRKYNIPIGWSEMPSTNQRGWYSG